MFSAEGFIRLVVFLALFFVSFYAWSCVDFAKFCKVRPAQKIYLLLFLLSLCTAWIATQCLLTLTLYGAY